MQRATDAEACGCDEVHGTQVAYDESKGEVIVLDDDTEEAADDGSVGQLSQQHPAVVSHETKASHIPTSSTLEGRKRVAPAAVTGSQGRRFRDTARRPKDSSEEIIDLTKSEGDGSDASPVAKGESTIGESRGLATGWHCRVCTYLNQPKSRRCEMCGTARAV